MRDLNLRRQLLFATTRAAIHAFRIRSL